MAALTLVPSLLLGSILLGARLPLPGFPSWLGLGPLDLSRGPRGVAPLREGFIADVLGRTLPNASAHAGRVPLAVSFSGSESENVSAPRTINHPLTNDNFDRAYPVSAVPFSARTNDAAATRQDPEPKACSPVGGTIWYRYTSAQELGLVADTFGSDHAVTLAVFDGNDLPSLHQDGQCSANARGNAHVAFAAEGGKTYWFQITRISGGNTVFNLRPQGITTRFLYGNDPVSVISPVFGWPSANGRYIGFTSAGQDHDATPSCLGVIELIPLLPSGCSAQGYIYDRVKKTTSLVSVNSRGEIADDLTGAAFVSDDGRYVTLDSLASNLDTQQPDNNTCGPYQIPGSCPDVYLHDRDADGNGIFDEKFPGAVKTIRVSLDEAGKQANAYSWVGAMSSDGRYIYMQCDAVLTKDDTNGIGDVYVYDRDADGNGIFDETFRGAHSIKRVTVNSRGEQAPDALDSEFPAEHGNQFLGISANGRYSAFRSPAANLDLERPDRNGAYDVFVHDVVKRTTVRINVSSNGAEADRGSRLPNSLTWKVSNDGRYAVFNSPASNLVPGPPVPAGRAKSDDLYVRDLVRQTTKLVTVGYDGSPAQGEPPISGQDAIFGGIITAGSAAAFGVWTLSELTHALTSDGRYVFFSSGATNLVPEDENGQRDIFVRDLWTGTTSIVSKSTAGEQADSSSQLPNPSADGRVCTFVSASSNLDAESSGVAPVYSTYLRVMPGGP